jgi:hypothetical protein
MFFVLPHHICDALKPVLSRNEDCQHGLEMHVPAQHVTKRTCILLRWLGSCTRQHCIEATASGSPHSGYLNHIVTWVSKLVMRYFTLECVYIHIHIHFIYTKYHYVCSLLCSHIFRCDATHSQLVAIHYEKCVYPAYRHTLRAYCRCVVEIHQRTVRAVPLCCVCCCQYGIIRDTTHLHG